MKDVIVIGGGLAGLVNTHLLTEAGLDVLLIEKKKYPFHRVCGEYVSNEVKPFLQRIGLFPSHLEPSFINKFLLTSTAGARAEFDLDLGAFGISRYELDHFFYKKVIEKGADTKLGVQVSKVDFEEDYFKVGLADGSEFRSRLVIGAQGKRSVLDKSLGRNFMSKRTDWIAVKYHVNTDFPCDTIALHNFEGGYCGVSSIEDGKYNICYLARRSHLRRYGDIISLENAVLRKNPYLDSLFSNSEFLFTKPVVINEISFAKKKAVEDHILMSGDAAGLITPLCGNGMAMAMHSAKVLSDMIASWFQSSKPSRHELEEGYTAAWHKLFGSRLWVDVTPSISLAPRLCRGLP